MPSGIMAEKDQHQFKDRYMLRMPDGLRDKIKEEAKANSRSMNAEIVARLEASLEGLAEGDSLRILRMLTEMQNKIAQLERAASVSMPRFHDVELIDGKLPNPLPLPEDAAEALAAGGMPGELLTKDGVQIMRFYVNKPAD